MELKLEYVDIDELVPYLNNAKIHTAEQIEQIKKSIEEFGMNDPIAVWKDNEIIEGHGRLIALKELGWHKAPVIKLDHLTEQQRKAYILIHNKLTMNTGFDLDILQMELEDIDIEMSDFGFLDEEISVLDESDDIDELSRYSQNIKIPQYEPKGDLPDISELVNTQKSDSLIEEINNADIDEETKQFLINASYRHNVFDYRKIAEFYAHQDADVQRFMEKSALVIIDINDAIANGYVQLTKTIQDIIDEDDLDA